MFQTHDGGQESPPHRIFTDALAANRQVQADQSGANGATTGRAGLEAAVIAIARCRREIQLAANAAWPASRKTNTGLRVEFGRPSDKALK